MNRAEFKFHEELNDFLPAEKRNSPVLHAFSGSPSIKDSIEAIGIPHPEIGDITVNGSSVDLSYHVHDGDLVSVFPYQSKTEDEPRFVLDGHLTRLAVYLRLFGFDSWHQNNVKDSELAEVSARENRILLTRDIGLLKRRIVRLGYWVRETNPREQLSEVLRHFNLYDRVKPFKKCLRCNGELQPVSKELVYDRLPPRTKKYFHEFYVCSLCRHVYWKGSHYEKMQNFIEEELTHAPLARRRAHP